MNRRTFLTCLLSGAFLFGVLFVANRLSEEGGQVLEPNSSVEDNISHPSAPRLSRSLQVEMTVDGEDSVREPKGNLSTIKNTNSLNMKVAVRRDGKELTGGIVEIQIAYSASLSRLDYQVVSPVFLRDEFRAEESVECATNELVSIPVELEGSYDVRARVLGTKSWCNWTQNTEQVLISKTIRIESHLRLKISEPSIKTIKSVVARPQIGSFDGVISARIVAGGWWEFEESIVLPIYVGIHLENLVNPFWVQVIAPDFEVSLGGLKNRPIAIEDAWSGHPIDNAVLTVAFRETHLRVPVDGSGVAEVPFPVQGAGDNLRYRGFAVHVMAPGYARALVGDVTSLSLRSDGTPVIQLLQEDAPGGHLTLSSGESSKGLRVTLIDTNSSLAKSVCNEAGQFTLAPGSFGGNVGTSVDPASTTFFGRQFGLYLAIRGLDGAFGMVGPIDWNKLAKGNWSHDLTTLSDWEIRILDADSQIPVPNCVVRRIPLAKSFSVDWVLDEKDMLAVSDKNGIARFGPAFLCSWNLEVDAPGFSNRSFPARPSPGIPTTIHLTRGKTMRLRFVDSAERPVTGVSVSLTRRNSRRLRATTGKNGEVSFTVGGDDKFLWGLSKTDLRPDLPRPLYLQAKEKVQTVRLLRWSKGILRVINEDGVSIERAIVSARRPGEPTTLFECGLQPIFPEGVLEIRAIAPGFLPSGWKSVMIDPVSAPVKVEFRLSKGYSVDGVLEPELSGTRVVLQPKVIDGLKYQPKDHPNSVSAGPLYFQLSAKIVSGRFRFENVSPGQYVLRVMNSKKIVLEQAVILDHHIDMGVLRMPR